MKPRSAQPRSTQGLTLDGEVFNAYEMFQHELITGEECKEAIERYYDLLEEDFNYET